MQIEDLIKEDEEKLESLMNRAPNDALDESMYPWKGEEGLNDNSGDNKEDQPQYNWDDQE